MNVLIIELMIQLMKSDCKGNVFFQQSMIKILFVQYQVEQVFPNSRFVLTKE